MGYETGFISFQANKKQIRKGITHYIEGYNVIILMNISKRSARPYIAKLVRETWLKAMKSMKFPFSPGEPAMCYACRYVAQQRLYYKILLKTLPTKQRAVEVLSSKRLSENQLKKITWNSGTQIAIAR